MGYPSVDALQKILAETVFSYATDRKKAAGRALGTLVEIITYCTLRAWHLSDNIVIERRIAEFANQDIHHNVEFSLHSVRSRHVVDASSLSTPFTSVKIQENIPFLKDTEVKRVQILGTNSVKRNAAVLLENDENLVVANIGTSHCEIVVCQLVPAPFGVISPEGAVAEWEFLRDS